MVNRTASVLFLLLVGWPSAESCIHKYGTSPEVLEAGGTPWDYSHAGADWQNGTDAKGNAWTCLTGRRQSPINVPTTDEMDRVPDEGRTVMDFGRLVSNGTNMQVRSDCIFYKLEVVTASRSPCLPSC